MFYLGNLFKGRGEQQSQLFPSIANINIYRSYNFDFWWGLALNVNQILDFHIYVTNSQPTATNFITN